MLETLYFQWFILNVNKIVIAMCFSKIICQFLLVCFEVCMSKISDKTGEILLNLAIWFEFILASIFLYGHSVDHLTCRNYAGVVVIFVEFSFVSV